MLNLHDFLILIYIVELLLFWVVKSSQMDRFVYQGLYARSKYPINMQYEDMSKTKSC
jgi:hypothetical protein